ncbi:hypothetical protein HBI24_212160 [Parastagonospora nodorum]|nr:hypothetical protein HBH49_226580 [Parastagonospora nodorum]KAH4799025.1 hypothetical protein HBH61_234700 [Parastagonospora nodorum]KAH4917865.1 hypothetical protein HBI79_214180 [Parastagonospora nodorum]KAH5107285.1 hypothetical protein HBH71_193510 [Parastagonospora nodorum]KAH5402887.1 hypothetical protein HBI47_187420 [Parastagonospora nodorum]
MEELQSISNDSLTYAHDHTVATVSGTKQSSSVRGAHSPTQMLSSNAGLQGENDIERWQACAGTEAEDDVGIVARLLQACIDSIAHLLLSADPSPACKQLRRSLVRMKLWANGHNAWNGGLDSILEKSKSLRHTTLSILNPLCRILSNDLYRHADSKDTATMELYIHTAQIYSQTKWLLKQAEEGVSESDSDSDSDSEVNSDSPGSEITSGGTESLAEDVKIHVQCLFDLSNALEYPAIDPEPTDEPSLLKVEQRAAHDYHKDLIVAKFPKVHMELAECLGKISWDRYQRMQEEREINASNPTGRPAEEEEMAASGQKSRFAESEFIDSGLGTSLPAPRSRYAETVISFMTSITGGKRIQIPPLPAEARTGAQFECNACGKHIRAATNRDWRKHLYLDLQPYTCLYDSCMFSAKPFANRQLWSQHLELDHQLGPSWESVVCPLCLEATDAGKSKMLIHFARHMEDIALAALPREVESDNESENEIDDASYRSAGSLILSTGEDKTGNEIYESHTVADDLEAENMEKPLRFTMDLEETARAQLLELEGIEKKDDPAVSKFITRPFMNPDKVHPLMASMGSSSCRCKVYELENRDWLDRGTGYANVIENEQAQWNLVVYAEDQTIQKLFLTPILMDGGYSKQKDTLIVWIEPDGTHMALSFETPESCNIVCDIINMVKRSAVAPKLALSPDRSDKTRPTEASASFPEPRTTAGHQGSKLDSSSNSPDARDSSPSKTSANTKADHNEADRRKKEEDARIAQQAQVEAETQERRELETNRQQTENQDRQQALHQNQLQPKEALGAATQAQQMAKSLLQKSPGFIDATDQQPYPRSIILNDIKPYIPPEVNTWRDIKQWATNNENTINMDELLRLQEVQFLNQEQKQNESAPTQTLEADTIKCLCGYSDDDGNTVLCELCKSWQHIVCYYTYSSHVPDVHECVDCRPRPIDREVAARVQRLRREYPLEDIRNEEDAKKAERKVEIERRCLQMDPPITPEQLRHMESFKASIQIAHPMNDESWAVLKPRLVAQLPAAGKRVLRVPTAVLHRLQAWLKANISNPYPSRDTRLALAQECGITEKQVSTWLLTNARSRKLHDVSDETGDEPTDELQKASRIHRCNCGRSYTRIEHLRRHQKNHSQEGALVCGLCFKVFYIRDLFERHAERHEKAGPTVPPSPEYDSTTSIPQMTIIGAPSPEARSPKFLQGKLRENTTHQRAGDAVVENAIPIPCDACQERQIICDRKRPHCIECIKSGTNCLYSAIFDKRSVRIRRKGLTAEQRAETMQTRRIGACADCKRRRIKCDPGTPCKPCLRLYQDDLTKHSCRKDRDVTGTGNEQHSQDRRSPSLPLYDSSYGDLEGVGAHFGAHLVIETLKNGQTAGPSRPSSSIQPQQYHSADYVPSPNFQDLLLYPEASAARTVDDVQRNYVPTSERPLAGVSTDYFDNPPVATSSAQSSSSRLRDSTNEDVQRALQAAQPVRSQEPLESTTIYESLYKQGSPYSRVNARQLQPGSSTSELESKTVTPKDALLDAADPGAGSNSDMVAERPRRRWQRDGKKREWDRKSREWDRESRE